MSFQIQVNAQTNGGKWGYMVSCWDGNRCLAAEWFATLPALP